jgi:hypothetical protein
VAGADNFFTFTTTPKYESAVQPARYWKACLQFGFESLIQYKRKQLIAACG